MGDKTKLRFLPCKHVTFQNISTMISNAAASMCVSLVQRSWKWMLLQAITFKKYSRSNM